MQLGTLAKIREQLKGKDKLCPKCDHPLTIEKTDYFETELCEHCLDHASINALTCCSSPDLYKVKLIISSGAIQVRHQCFSCGFVSSSSIGGLSAYERDNLPPVDQERRENWEDPRIIFHNEIRRLKSIRYEKEREEDKTEWFKQYNIYLLSPEWRQKRDIVLKRDNYKCQCCLTGLATQVHHKSYDLVDFKGSEPCFNLVSICTPCHELIHEKK